MGRINATDLRKGFDMDQFEAPIERSSFVFLHGINPWSMYEMYAAEVLDDGVCPVCEGKPLGRMAYCLGCDRTYLDGRVTYPGLKVGEALDPDWKDGDVRVVAVERLPAKAG